LLGTSRKKTENIALLCIADEYMSLYAIIMESLTVSRKFKTTKHSNKTTHICTHSNKEIEIYYTKETSILNHNSVSMSLYYNIKETVVLCRWMNGAFKSTNLNKKY